MPLTIARGAVNRQSRNSPGTLWVLLVGVNQYGDAGLNDLRFAVADCQGVADVLAAADLPFQARTTLVHHDDGPLPPTREAVVKSLAHLTANVAPRDAVLFYFCGHALASGTSAVLCLADTVADTADTTGLPLATVLDALAHCQAAQRFVWLDACQSGSLDSRSTSKAAEHVFEDLRASAAQSQGFYAMLSCDRREYSWEFAELGHGLFSYFLIRGLQGEAAGVGGAVTVDDLYQYVFDRTLGYIDRLNQQLRLENEERRRRGTAPLSEYPQQTPRRVFEGVGSQVLVREQAMGIAAIRRRAFMVGDGEADMLALARLLSRAGGFQVEYALSGRHAPAALRQKLGDYFDIAGTHPTDTALVYLAGHCRRDEHDEPYLEVDGARLGLIWLRRQLARSRARQVLLFIDMVAEAEEVAVWCDELTQPAGRSHCLILAALPEEAPESFSCVLRIALEEADRGRGLSAAALIGRLQGLLATCPTFATRLVGGHGIIDVLPPAAELVRSLTGDLGICPYMGLQAFEVQDAPFFFGREELLGEVLTALAVRPLLALVGASGSGKSSLARAGLLAALAGGRRLPGSERWWTGIMMPGSDPVAALISALTANRDAPPQEAERLEGLLYYGQQGGSEGLVQWLRAASAPMVVLLIDQFEELFTLTPPGECARFLNLLLAALSRCADRFRVVATLRADFVANCLEIPGLGELLTQGTVLVLPVLHEQDYRRVICEPARAVGLTVEPELVEALLGDLEQSVGELPLLEFVLTQLWELRTDGYLTVQSYQQQIGGLAGAIEKKAQQVYEALDESARACARWLFLEMTRLGEGTGDSRRRLRRANLRVERYPDALVERTLAALTAAKLVVVNTTSAAATSRSPDHQPLVAWEGEVTIEVAHEVLIRHWSTLRWWLEENRARLRSKRQVEQAAALWLDKGEDAGLLLRGSALAEAEAVYGESGGELTLEVRRFVETSLAERDRQSARDRRRLRLAYGTSAVLAVLVLVTGAATWQALHQSREARLNEVEALRTSAENLFIIHRQLEALTTAVQASQVLAGVGNAPSALRLRTEDTLANILFAIQERNRLDAADGWVGAVAVSPDGRTIYSGSSQIHVWSAAGTRLRTLRGHTRRIYGLDASPDGRLLASASPDRTVRLWESASGKAVATLTGHTDTVFMAVFSPDSQFVASASRDRTVRLWQRDGRPLAVLRGHTDTIYAVAFSPDGRLLASASRDRTVRLWERATGRNLAVLSGHSDVVRSVAFSPDGRHLLSAGDDGTLRLWHSDGTFIKVFAALDRPVARARFDPTGGRIAAVGHDRIVHIWNREGSLLQTLTGHTLAANDLRFSPDGSAVISAGEEGVVRLWRTGNPDLLTLHVDAENVLSATFSPDGHTLAAADSKGGIHLWDTGTWRRRLRLQAGRNPLNKVLYSPDGTWIAAGSDDRQVRVWTAAGKLLYSFTVAGSVRALAFDPQSRLLAAAINDGRAFFWDLGDGRPVRQFAAHRGAARGISFNADGSLVATAGEDGAVRIWAVGSGRLLHTLRGHSTDVWEVRFAPRGTLLASGDTDGSVLLWNAATGRSLGQLSAQGAWVQGLAFDTSGRWLLASDNEGKFRVWQTDGTLLRTLRGSNISFHDAAFSPDGALIAVATSESSVQVWRWRKHGDNLAGQGCRWLADFLRNTRAHTSGERNVRNVCNLSSAPGEGTQPPP
jgi:WD40 repeat protein/uncharacterized caspase-like protein